MLVTLILLVFLSLFVALKVAPQFPEPERRFFFWAGFVIAAALASISASELSRFNVTAHLPIEVLVLVIILGFIFIGLAALTWFDRKAPNSSVR